MAFPARYSGLTKEEQTRIFSDLWITPTRDSVNMRGPPGHSGINTAPPPFPFYLLSTETDTLKLPLFYARSLFGAAGETDGEGPTWGRLPSGVQSPGIAMRGDHQESIFRECLTQVQRTGGVTLHVPPGTGKTILATLLAQRLGHKFAILVPRETLIEQWVKTIQMVFTPTPQGMVWVPLPPSTERKRSQPETDQIVAETLAIVSLGERASTTPQPLREQIGTLIIDEAHLCCVPSWVPVLLEFAPRYVIALTATMDRPDGAHSMMSAMAGPVRVVRQSERPLLVLGARLPQITIPEALHPSTGHLDYTKFVASMAENEALNTHIVQLIQTNLDRKWILLFRRVDHTELIHNRLQALGISTGILCGTRKNYTDCTVLCGSYGKISTGFDAATFATNFDGVNPDTLLLVNGTKQSSLFTQSAGRILRANPGTVPTVIIPILKNRICSTHFSSIRSTAEQMKGVVKRVEWSELTTTPSQITVLSNSLCGGGGGGDQSLCSI